MGGKSSKQLLMMSVKANKYDDIKKIIAKHPELLDDLINTTKDYTAVGTAAFLGKFEAAKTLLELGCNLTIPCSKDRNSPLILASIRNRIDIFELLLEKGANVNYVNIKGLNCLDYAIINCNYIIAYSIITKTDLNFRTLEEYLKLSQYEKIPMFNLLLFHQTLENRVEPDKIPSFVITKDQEKRFEGKIPDPDETWTNFFKRILKFEIHKPPLVDVETIPEIKRTSTYMKVQAKLLEVEYKGAKVNLLDKNEPALKENMKEMNIIEKEQNDPNISENKENLFSKIDNDCTSLKDINDNLEINSDNQEKNIENPEIIIEEFHEQEQHIGLENKHIENQIDSNFIGNKPNTFEPDKAVNNSAT